MAWDQIIPWLQSWSPVAYAVVAGAAGGLVRTAVLREKGLGAYTSNMTAGAACSVFLGPAIAPLLRPIAGDASYDDIAGLAGFIAGLTGILIAGWIMDMTQKRVGRE